MAYPNRLHALHAMHVNAAVKRAYGMVQRFLSDRFKRKILLENAPLTDLAAVMPIDSVPLHLGGSCNHADAIMGPDGIFSWQRMVDNQTRLMQQLPS